jgi:hypothetical protein
VFTLCVTACAFSLLLFLIEILGCLGGNVC